MFLFLSVVDYIVLWIILLRRYRTNLIWPQQINLTLTKGYQGQLKVMEIYSTETGLPAHVHASCLPELVPFACA